MTEPFWEKSYPPGVTWKQAIPEAPVWTVIDEATRRFGHRPALEFMGKVQTYAAVDALIDRAAKGFRTLGVGPGVHVGLFLPNTPHYVICFFAILKAGGRVVNYSPLDAERELRFKIENSQTDIVVTLSLNALYPVMGKMLGSTRLKKIVVCALEDVLPFPKNLLFPLLKRAQIARVPQDDRHIPFARLIDNDGVYAPHVVKDAKTEVAVLQYTGGTTGEPKGAMLTHYNLMAAMTGYRAFTQGDKPLAIEGKERALVILPLFHIYGLSAVMLRLLAGGAKLVLHPRFELQAVLKDLHAKKITCMSGVPTMYAAIVNAPDIGKYDLSALKLCTVGGAPLPAEIQEKFRRLTGCYLSEGWGMTETSPLGTWKPDTGGDKKGSCGLPLPNVTIEVVDVDDPLKLLAVGEVGEICITGPNVMVGYWNNPEATREAFAGGRFHTGDIGYIDQDGFVFLVDRKKDMILSGGFNVYPRNIEEAIYEHPAVAECTVIGIPDDYRGQSAKAFIALRDGATPFSFDELKAFLAPRLGKHEMPAAMDIRAHLPKTMIGKLSKKELVEEERTAHEARKAADAPLQSETQRHVFRAERAVATIPDVPEDTPTRPIKTAGVIGAGTMGGGIAMTFANVGIPVIIAETTREALDRGLGVIAKNYAATVRKGRLSQGDMDKRLGLIRGTLDYGDLRDCDIVIEAAFENMALKKEIFARLDAGCKPGAILATNTSTLDVNEIAAATRRPQDVVGTHFFSPAHVMRLLEIVRAKKTGKDVVATAMSLARTIGKVGVLVGVCPGFVGNRMLHQYSREAQALLEEGALPQQVDRILRDWGFAMGPFAVMDLAGIDVGWRIRKEREPTRDKSLPYSSTVADRLAEKGRFGQKTRRGWYLYEEGSRAPIPDPDVERMLIEVSREKGIARRAIPDEEILKRCLYQLVNEGAKILDEGIAQRAGDIDVIYIHGYGFPAHRGGPMFYAEQTGLKAVHDDIRRFHERHGAVWEPAALLARLARAGKGFGDP